MNNKLIILVGISGSGKSSWSHSQWKENPSNTVVISRDKIRELLFSFDEKTITSYYIRRDIRFLEETISKTEKLLIDSFLSAGYNVIIDNTHLKAEYLNKYDIFDCKKEIIIFDVDLEEAIKRDSERTRKVGSRVIKDQYKKYKNLVKWLKNNKLKYEYDLQEINTRL